jgi:hypothetical protein
MTLQEIQDLAGHRDVPPWVVKLVGDAVAREREACAEVCDDLDDDLPDGLAGWQYGEAIRARGQA